MIYGDMPRTGRKRLPSGGIEGRVEAYSQSFETRRAFKEYRKIRKALKIARREKVSHGAIAISIVPAHS